MSIISKPLACATDSSSSKRSIQFERESGGRYTLHTRNGLAFGNVISAQIVSKLEISISGRRLTFNDSLKYMISPPPYLFNSVLSYKITAIQRHLAIRHTGIQKCFA